MTLNFNLMHTTALDEIVYITDKDFGIKPIKHDRDPVVRLGARGIVVNENREIALLYKAKKKEYKLPGGGVDDGEDSTAAFQRECREELGCTIDIQQKLGVAVEYKSQENFKQLSFVYSAQKVADLGNNSLTEKEKDEGATVVWLPKLEALEKNEVFD